MTTARYIMVGGFLGAGKTTTLLRLAKHYRDQGKRVGLITNDQSVGLVDTAMLGSHDFPVEEITGGCFCCRFQSLTAAAEKLTAADRPDIFLAEPVGSCTDLAATVSYPLRRMYGDQFSIAPYTVLIDPIRAERILGLATGKVFSPKVIYIYRKQLEEADIIIVNKIELLDPARLDKLTAALTKEFPKARLVTFSARTGTNFEAWTDLLNQIEHSTAPTMEVDYDVYAEGEALLGWMNCSATLDADDLFDGNGFLRELTEHLRQALAAQGVEIAHLKMTLSPDEGSDLAVINLVRTDGQVELSHTLTDGLQTGELLMNLRAEASPEAVRELTERSLAEVASRWGVRSTVQHLEAFRPGRPVPTHRLTGV